MIVRTLEDCRNSARCVRTATWESVRLSLKDDGMGFSFHVTTIFANTETPIHYRNHLETVYCVAGHGEVEILADGKIHPIAPGTVYILDQHDQHLLRAHGEDLVLVCAFNPPLNGKEVHDEHGVYPLEAEGIA